MLDAVEEATALKPEKRTVGLTTGVVSDDFGGERTPEGGELVTANDGVACIDELDKVDEETLGRVEQVFNDFQSCLPLSHRPRIQHDWDGVTD